MGGGKALIEHCAKSEAPECPHLVDGKVRSRPRMVLTRGSCEECCLNGGDAPDLLPWSNNSSHD